MARGPNPRASQGVTRRLFGDQVRHMKVLYNATTFGKYRVRDATKIRKVGRR